MKAGDLDRQLTIRRFESGRDEFNNPIMTWVDLATVPASWRRASAREQLAASEIAATVTDIFEIRWSTDVADVNPTDRVLYQGREFNLSEVTEIGRREGLRLRGSARAE